MPASRYDTETELHQPHGADEDQYEYDVPDETSGRTASGTSLEDEPYLFISRLPPLHLCTPAGREAALPAKAAGAPRGTLVLDLDETLVHSSLDPDAGSPLARPHDFFFPVQFEDATHTVYVRRRPGVQAFLDYVSSKFEVVLFTASHPSYANPLLDILDPEGRIFSHRLFFDSCLLVDGTYVKDLSVLGRDLTTTAIVDNTPQAYGFHPDNAIPILSWYDDPNDDELAQLLPLMDDLAVTRDVRPFLAAKFGVAQRAQQAAERAFAAALAELSSAATTTAAATAPRNTAKTTTTATSTQSSAAVDAGVQADDAPTTPPALADAREQARKATEAAAEAAAAAAAARAALEAARQAATGGAVADSGTQAVGGVAGQKGRTSARSKSALVASAVQRAAKRSVTPVSLSQAPAGSGVAVATPPAAAAPALPAVQVVEPEVRQREEKVRTVPVFQVVKPLPPPGPPELGAGLNGEAPETEEEDETEEEGSWRAWSPPSSDVPKPSRETQALVAETAAGTAAASESEWPQQERLAPGADAPPRPAVPAAPAPGPPAAAPGTSRPPPPPPPHPRGPSWTQSLKSAVSTAALGAWSTARAGASMAASSVSAVAWSSASGARSVTVALGSATLQAASAAVTQAGSARAALRALSAGKDKDAPTNGKSDGGATAAAVHTASIKAQVQASTADASAPAVPSPVRVRQTATAVLPASQPPSPAATAPAKARPPPAPALSQAVPPAVSSLGDWTSDDGGRTWRSAASQRRTPLPPLPSPSPIQVPGAMPSSAAPPLRRVKPSADGSAVVFIGEVRPRSVGLLGARSNTPMQPLPSSPRAGNGGALVGWTTMDGGRTWRRATETVPLPAHKRLQVLLMARLHSAQAGPTIGVALLAFLLALLAASR